MVFRSLDCSAVVLKLREAFEPPVYEKTPDQESRINDVLSKSFLFNALSKDDLKVILGAFLEKKIPAGERIIQEGDDGDVMFLIESGAFDCIKKIDGHSSYVSQRFFQFIHLFVYTLLPWFQVCVCVGISWIGSLDSECPALFWPSRSTWGSDKVVKKCGQGIWDRNRVQPDVPTMGAVNDVNGYDM